MAEEGKFVERIAIRHNGRTYMGRGVGPNPKEALAAAVADVLTAKPPKAVRKQLKMRQASRDPELFAELWEAKRF